MPFPSFSRLGSRLLLPDLLPRPCLPHELVEPALRFQLRFFVLPKHLVVSVETFGLDSDHFDNLRLKGGEVSQRFLKLSLRFLAHRLLAIERGGQVCLVLDGKLKRSINFFRCHVSPEGERK